MPLLEWKQEFSVSDTVIDSQHRVLVDLINELHDAMSQGKGMQVLTDILNRMAEYTIEHFRTEEGMMERKAYPDLAAHREQHQAFVRQVSAFQEQMQQKKILLSLSVSTFLKDWLSDHILQSDQAYADFFKKKA